MTIRAAIAGTRAIHLWPVFSLTPNSAQISAIGRCRSRQAWMKVRRSDMGELSRHGTGTSRRVPECEAGPRPAHPSIGFFLTYHSGLYPADRGPRPSAGAPADCHHRPKAVSRAVRNSQTVGRRSNAARPAREHMLETIAASSLRRPDVRPSLQQRTGASMAASNTRVEHDLLGDLAVPADAYYGVQTAR